jgi:hypothetical protein
MKNFGYQAERFRAAVCALMLPHPKGEADAIAAALHECHLAFQDLDPDDLEESAKEWVQKLEKVMRSDAVGGELPGKWLTIAEGLTVDQKSEISNCVFELNAWFHMYFWSSREEL